MLISAFEFSSWLAHQTTTTCLDGLSFLAAKDTRNGNLREATSTSDLDHDWEQMDSHYSNNYYAWTGETESTPLMLYSTSISKQTLSLPDRKIYRNTRIAMSLMLGEEVTKSNVHYHLHPPEVQLAWGLMSGRAQGH